VYKGRGLFLNNAIVIPALNESQTIVDVISQVAYAGEVIVVDDGSVDETKKNAENAGATVISHKDNQGYDVAIESGIKLARELNKETVITFDADGQHDPMVLGEILELLYRDRYDLVIGTRPGAARFSEFLFDAYINHRYQIKDILCGLKGYRLDAFSYPTLGFRYQSIGTRLALDGLLCGVRSTTLPITIRSRKDNPRFGSSLRANFRISKALACTIIHDLANSKRTRLTGTR
jgi:glycosyltransferase involved in cell wall biosynthesis